MYTHVFTSDQSTSRRSLVKSITQTLQECRTSIDLSCLCWTSLGIVSSYFQILEKSHTETEAKKRLQHVSVSSPESNNNVRLPVPLPEMCKMQRFVWLHHRYNAHCACCILYTVYTHTHTHTVHRDLAALTLYNIKV